MASFFLSAIFLDLSEFLMYNYSKVSLFCCLYWGDEMKHALKDKSFERRVFESLYGS